MKRILLILLLTAGICATSRAQQAYDRTAALKDFDYLVAKVQNDYPGYADKVKPELFTLKQAMRAKVGAHPDSARYYFKRYLSFFTDGHLRINLVTSPHGTPVTLNEVSSYGQTLAVDTAALMRENKAPQSIEGIWTSSRGDIAIVDKRAERGSFAAVSMNFQNWTTGQVPFELTPTDTAQFELKIHTMVADRQPGKGEASLEMDGKVLDWQGTNLYFVRKSDNPVFDKAFLASAHPQFPNGTNTYWLDMPLDDSTFYLRIVTFDPSAKDYIASMIAKDRNAILSRPNLIIDIRSNNGGQDDSYAPLLPLLYTQPYVQQGVVWYASQDNIDEWEEELKNGDIREGGEAWSRALLNEMKKHKGEFVVHPWYKAVDTVVMEHVYTRPHHVGIIIDRYNASTAEQFLLEAQNSRKVTLFGKEHTAGVLDYSNITPHTLPSGQFELWLPATRSLRLPEHPIDNIGIAPDIIIPLPAASQLYDRLDDWVYFVKNYLEAIQ